MASGSLAPWRDAGDTGRFNFSFRAEGYAPANGEEPPRGNFRMVSPDFFSVLSTPSLLGRAVSQPGERTAVMSEALWRSRFGADPRVIGKTISLDGAMLPGPPRTVILDEAERWGADLIVVGSHGYRAWERFLLGSVSQAVVSHAKCSVEVVRCRPAPYEAK